MKITSVTGIYFSAVGNTKKTVEWITDRMAKKLGVTQKPSIDFTLPGSRHTEYVFSEQELAVFGIPVYAGRIPNKILPFVQTLFHGNDALAVPVVTFGNRSYDNALIELCAELEANGFHTVAGAAVAAEHVMSDKIAPERPDQRDKWEILDFADRSAQKIQQMDAVCKPVSVKGEYPAGPYYTPLDENGNPAKFLKAKPVTDVKNVIIVWNVRTSVRWDRLIRMISQLFPEFVLNVRLVSKSAERGQSILMMRHCVLISGCLKPITAEEQNRNFSYKIKFIKIKFI